MGENVVDIESVVEAAEKIAKLDEQMGEIWNRLPNAVNDFLYDNYGLTVHPGMGTISTTMEELQEDIASGDFWDYLHEQGYAAKTPAREKLMRRRAEEWNEESVIDGDSLDDSTDLTGWDEADDSAESGHPVVSRKNKNKPSRAGMHSGVTVAGAQRESRAAAERLAVQKCENVQGNEITERQVAR